MRKERCYNGGDKHNFKPRYDENEAKNKQDYTFRIGTNLREYYYYTTYIKDVCIWCGKEIKRENDNV